MLTTISPKMTALTLALGGAIFITLAGPAAAPAISPVAGVVEVWQAAVLGLVEGITEYLPVSSTGHLIITSSLLGLDEPEQVKQAVDAFNVVIQGGAILAVLGLYFPRVLQMLAGLVGRDREGRKLMINLIVAFLPAAVLGVLLDELISGYLFNTPSVLAALVLGGVWMIWLDRAKLRQHREHEGNLRARARGSSEDGDSAVAERESEEATDTLDGLTWKRALVIGFLQCFAMWPGTSRSMMTIAGGVLVGLKPKAAAEFSFLLGLPTLGGACVYKLGKNLLASREAGEPNLFEVIGWGPAFVGILVATVSAAVAVKWLVAFLNNHGLAAFGYYRIVLAVVLGVLIATNVVQL